MTLRADTGHAQPTTTPASAAVWMGAALAAALALACAVLARFGAGAAGTQDALRVTARLAFLFFWPSYVGGALADLFGPMFQPLKARARQLGLAFATVLAVHLTLVGWLCWIGAPPSLRTFAIFGVGAVWTGLLAAASIERLGAALGPRSWWVLRNVGMTYIAFAFVLDFVRLGRPESGLFWIGYAPFAALAILAPVLRLLAWLRTAMTARAAARV